MTNRFVIILFVVALALTSVAVVSTSATFRFRSPKDPKVRFVIDKKTGGAVLAPDPNEKAPRIQVVETEFDFGMMDPLRDGRHDFVIKNVGDAPLKLTMGETSCKCTVGGMSREEIPPGETGTIALEWNTGQYSLHFSHYAVVHTNDLLKKLVQFRVNGKVRMLISADVPEVIVSLAPDRPQQVEVLLYSQIWEDFSIASIDSKLTDLKWEELPADQPADAVAKEKLEAKVVRRLKITVPGNLPQGSFSDILRMKLQPAGEGSAIQEFALPIQGKMTRRFSLYGNAISDGVIDFGAVPQGTGKTVKLLVKIRDTDQQLHVTRIEAKPAFLKARLEPRADKADAPGMYDLFVELPASVDPCQYLGDRPGQIKILTTHPRIAEVDLKVSFAVTPRL